MNFTQARALAQSVASNVSSVHSSIDNLKALIETGSVEQVRNAAESLNNTFGELHKKLGVADVAAARLFVHLESEAKLILQENGEPVGAIATLSGGTPKDDPAPQRQAEDDDAILTEEGEAEADAFLSTNEDATDEDDDSDFV